MKTCITILLCLLVGSACAQGIDDLCEIQVIRLNGGAVLYVPDMITPNGDGINDSWKIGWTSDFDAQQHRLEIYDAFSLLASFSPIGSFWNGKNLPEGQYRFIIYHEQSDQSLGSGNITINRFEAQRR